jgi:hypothetical protein
VRRATCDILCGVRHDVQGTESECARFNRLGSEVVTAAQGRQQGLTYLLGRGNANPFGTKAIGVGKIGLSNTALHSWAKLAID